MFRKKFVILLTISIVIILTGCRQSQEIDNNKTNVVGYWYRSQNNLAEYISMNADGEFQNWILFEPTGGLANYIDGTYIITGSKIEIIPNNGTKYTNTLEEISNDTLVLTNGDTRATYIRITREELMEKTKQ